eukprot:scaffold5337_cov411-Prasinococcus_capsulatus_cf.AAC.2
MERILCGCCAVPAKGPLAGAWKEGQNERLTVVTVATCTWGGVHRLDIIFGRTPSGLGYVCPAFTCQCLLGRCPIVVPRILLGS